MTASDASTIAADATVLHPTELPSQVDDLDGDEVPDELAFQIDLKPHQTRIVTVTWGPVNRIFRLRGDYPQQTDAVFTKKIDGVGWESKRNAFRLYFDTRNAIDLFGKAKSSLQLASYSTPGYVYHNSSPGELGIRMAVGASRSQLMTLVLGQSLKMTTLGIAIGSLISLLLAHFLTSSMYEIRPNDPITFIAVAIFIAAISGLAAFVPARRGQVYSLWRLFERNRTLN